MSNGCICCTLLKTCSKKSHDSPKKIVSTFLLIESTGISEPMPVVATFLFKDIEGHSLSSMARLDTMVSVVDAATFLDRFEVLEELHGAQGRDDARRPFGHRSPRRPDRGECARSPSPISPMPASSSGSSPPCVSSTPRRAVVAEKGDLPLDAVLDTGPTRRTR